MSVARASHPHRRPHSAFSLTGLLSVLALGGVVAAGAIWLLRPMLLGEKEETNYLVDHVKVGIFTHDVVERGEVESSSNVDVRSEVQSRSSGGAAIIEIVDEGTIVKEGDFLVRLDDSALRDELTAQQSVVNASDATVIQSLAALATAEIAKKEYEEGTFKQDEELLHSEVFVAEENLRRAQEYARHSERLAAKGYVTQVQLEADHFAVKKAEADLALANTKLMVLRNFTKAKMLESLNADVKIAEARLKADQKTNTLDRTKLEFIQSQITKCVINAPSDGQVVYANETAGRGGQEVIIQEGTVVRERQVIVRLPDPTRMQVKARINESRIDFIREDYPVVIRLDALPGVELKGIVRRVSDYPIPTGWFGNSVKEYATYVEILEPPSAMRPGMTAEVAIRVDQQESALQLPVQAVFERGGRHWSIIPEASGLVAHEVKIGATNDKVVIIREGLKKDDIVLSNPRKYLNQVDLPAGQVADQKEMMAEMPTREKADEDKRKRLASAEGAGGGRNGGGPGGGGDPAAMVAGMMQRMDKDKNGKLDEAELAELPEQFRTGLKQADTNKDGVIDTTELTTAMRAFAASGGGGGRPGANAGGGGAGP